MTSFCHRGYLASGASAPGEAADGGVKYKLELTLQITLFASMHTPCPAPRMLGFIMCTVASLTNASLALLAVARSASNQSCSLTPARRSRGTAALSPGPAPAPVLDALVPETRGSFPRRL